jgi:predicted phosphoadenosine phosphosulfate sulfurtransferase
MSRQRMFLDINVVDAARQRIRHVYDTFDTVCVQFSGGKDSTAILYLAKEVHEERGLGPVKVIFRDEEMLSPLTEAYIKKVSEFDWVDMEWYCLPYGTEVWVMGHRESTVLWGDKRRELDRLVRDFPEGAITAYDFGIDHSQNLPEPLDHYQMQGKHGNVAFITGIRAAESMIRYRSLVQKLHENYIVHPYGLSKRVPLKFAKVIYDWSANDVFKYITEEHDAPYCEYYDYAALTGSNARVGIPLHAVAIRRIGDVVETEPEFYDRLYECFPHIDGQRRWGAEVDYEQIIENYASKGWDGVRQFISDYMYGPNKTKRAKAFAAEFRRKHIQDPYGYPWSYLIRQLLLNAVVKSKSVSPVGPKTRADTVRKAMEEQGISYED